MATVCLTGAQRSWPIHPCPAKGTPASSLVAALDLGVNILAAITSTKSGFVPLLVNGRPQKSLNQGDNKQRAHYQSKLSSAKRFTSHRLDRITTKRTRRVNAYLHMASRRIIDRWDRKALERSWWARIPCGSKGSRWGAKTTRSLFSPHGRFIEMLTYQASLVGIRIILQEERYTSQASFLDRDPLPTYDPKRAEKPRFGGKREKRGLYRAADGRRIHADVRGSYNILRKAFPNSFGQGIAPPAVVPRRLAV